MSLPRHTSLSGCRPAQAPTPSAGRPTVPVRRPGGVSPRGRAARSPEPPRRSRGRFCRFCRFCHADWIRYVRIPPCISAVSARAVVPVFRLVIPNEARDPSPCRVANPTGDSRCRHESGAEHESCANDGGNFADSNNCNTCNICMTIWESGLSGSRRLSRRRGRATSTSRNSRSGVAARAGGHAGGHAAREDFPPFPPSHPPGAIQRSSPGSEDFPQFPLALPCRRKLPRARRWSRRPGGLSAIPAVSSAGCDPEVVSGLRRLSASPAGSAVLAQTAPSAPVVLPRRRTFRHSRCLIRGVWSRGRLRAPKTFRNSRWLCRAGANCPARAGGPAAQEDFPPFPVRQGSWRDPAGGRPAQVRKQRSAW